MSRLLHLRRSILSACACVPAFAGVAAAQDYSSSFRYDALHRLTGQVDADPDGGGPLHFPAVRYTWSVDGQLVLIEKGVLLARPAVSVAPANWSNFTVQQQTAIAYDIRGLQTEERVTANGQFYSVTQYSYDADGRLECTAVRMDLGNVPAVGSPVCTNPVVGSDGPDRITKTIYDTADQVLQVRRGVGTSLEQAYATYTYTPNGDGAYIIDAVGNRARFDYDGFGRKQSWWFPQAALPTGFNPSTPATAVATAGGVSGVFESFSYDENDNLVTQQMRDGRSVALSYDNLNRKYRRRYSDAAGNYEPSANWVFYGYDLRGLQTYARYGSTTGAGVSSTYDGAGRLTQSADNVGGAALALQYRYDEASNRTRVTHPDSKFFVYDYDRLSRVKAIKENGTTTELATISYDDTGQRSGVVRLNGTSTAYDYFDVPRLKTLTHDLAGTAGDVEFDFTYNAAGQAKARTRSNESYAFVPPAVSTQSYVRNGLNQYTSVGGTAYGYDVDGNLTSDGSSTFVYDVENRLLTATGGKTATLTYDPMGRLHSTKGASASSETRFLYDGDALVAEYDVNGLLLRRYVHGPGVDEPMVWYEGSAIASTARRFIHADRQGSVIGISDSAGASLAINRYDSWGVADPGNLGRFQYTGQIAMPELGMYHYKARVYAPQLGRFLQTDPVGYDDQVNLYAYVANDPVSKADPTGLCGAGSNDEYGCRVTGTSAGNPLPGVPVIRADDVAAINGHAVTGDGSPRQADFTEVSLAGLGKVIFSYASEEGSPLNRAIETAIQTGKPVDINITTISAGGEIGGKSPTDQQLGIGRFAVDIAASVTATGEGQWSMSGVVTANADVQDYGTDSKRGAGGSIATKMGSVMQNLGGGKDYILTFFGNQRIMVDGRWVGKGKVR